MVAEVHASPTLRRLGAWCCAALAPVVGATGAQCALPRSALTATPLHVFAGDAQALVQIRMSARRKEGQVVDTSQDLVFSGRDVAMSRMLYSFFLLVGCNELFSPKQQAGSTCKHCQAAGFDYEPGQVRLITEHKDTMALVARLHPRVGSPGGPEGCAVAVRGTHNMGDVFSDLAFARVPLPGCTGCRVHRAWLSEWRLVQGAVRRQLRELGCNSSRHALYLTGHSSGCAVIDYMAMDLHLTDGFAIQTSIGFNCPKPGDAAFAAAFHAAFPTGMWKVQVDLDPIRHLPPLWTGYRDVGYAIQYVHGERGHEGFRRCGRGAALCGSDTRRRLLIDFAQKINSFHCAPPHPNEWPKGARGAQNMRCDARCSAELVSPDWNLLPLNAGEKVIVTYTRLQPIRRL